MGSPRREPTALLLVAFLGLGLGACASAGLPAPGRETRDQMDELQTRVLALQRQATMNEVEIARLRQQVAALEARLGERGSAGAPSSESRVRELPPPPDPAPALLREDAVVEEEIDAPPVPRTAPAPVSTPSPSVSPTPSPAGPPVEPLDRAGQARYDEAYTLYHQGRYPEAENAFRDFLAEHPATELSDNAQYWIGAARFAAEDHSGALRAFREVVERYPDGNKVPDALYKIGQCLEAVGDPDAAREVYRGLRERFPNTAAASLAADRLAALG